MNGRFSFDDLPPGAYQLTVAANGLTSVSSTTIHVTVAEGQQIVAHDGLIDPVHEAAQLIVDTRLGLGWVRASEVRGTIWQDQSGDGISPDDTGRAEILVQARRDDGDEVLDSNDEFIAESLTDSDGTFRITFPFPGSYWIQATLPDGYVRTPLNETSAVQFVTLSSGQVAADNDFAIAQLPRIRGQVRDNETLVGLAGRRIFLVSSSGETVDEVVTDVDGHYEFTVPVPGEYDIQEDVPFGWEPHPAVCKCNSNSSGPISRIDSYRRLRRRWRSRPDRRERHLVDAGSIQFTDGVSERRSWQLFAIAGIEITIWHAAQRISHRRHER